jgi:23S rRNA (cytosine1962-C5)-methyltransferase
VPGLAVDRYGEVGIVHAGSAVTLAAALPELRAGLPMLHTAYGKVHPRRANRRVPAELRALAPVQPLWGPDVAEVIVSEAGVRYLVRPTSGLSVGLFLDMREVRAWLPGVAAGRHVLNLFAYTCSFGVCAALGGAARVLNLDLARPYLAWGKQNYQLQDLPIRESDFVYGEAFDWLARFARRGELFDLVIVDPPSFSSAGFAVARDYPRLITAAARVVAPTGILLAASNHAGTSDARFASWLRSALETTGRQSRLMRRWHEPAVDFPVAQGGQPYLKVRALALE